MSTNKVTNSQTTNKQLQESQMPSTQPEVKKNYWKLGFFVALLLWLLSVVILVAYFDKKVNKSSEEAIKPAKPSPETTAVPTDTTQTSDVAPEKNSLYLGVYEGKEALFVTDEKKQQYYEPGAVSKTSPFIGELTIIDNSGRDPFDFKELVNPKKIFKSTKPIYGVNNFRFNDSQDVLYISLLFQTDDKKDLLNKAMQIDLTDLSVNELWSNIVGSDKYPEGKGYALIDQVIEDKYITLTVFDCYACGGTPIGTIVLNISSKTEKYYQMIGDMQFNLQNNTLTYKKLAPFKESCEPGQGCVDGQRTVYKPAGETYSDSLP